MPYEEDARAIRAAQARLRQGETAALQDIYLAAVRIAAGMVARQCERRRLGLSMEQIAEKAHDAASYVAEQFMRRPGFALRKPASYIYTCVLKEMYGRKRRGRAAAGRHRPADKTGERRGDD